jgi:DNA-binding NarL/FixJ family response regulator
MADSEIVVALGRISKILAGLLLKDIEDGEQTKKIKRLKSCGFSNTEIAEMLNTTVNTINGGVHGLKRKKGGKNKRRR